MIERGASPIPINRKLLVLELSLLAFLLLFAGAPAMFAASDNRRAQAHVLPDSPKPGCYLTHWDCESSHLSDRFVLTYNYDGTAPIWEPVSTPTLDLSIGIKLISGMVILGACMLLLIFVVGGFERDTEPRITGAPSNKLIKLVLFVYSAKTIERIFDPIYADFCEEYFAALAAGEKWHARWICIRYYKDFVKAIGLFGVVRLAKTVFEYWEKIA